MHDELPDMLLHTVTPAVGEMGPISRLVVSSLAVSSSVAVVYLAPFLIPYVGELVAVGLGIVLGGLSSILVVSASVVLCRGIRRVAQVRRMRQARDAARAAPVPGPVPPVVG